MDTARNKDMDPELTPSSPASTLPNAPRIKSSTLPTGDLSPIRVTLSIDPDDGLYHHLYNANHSSGFIMDETASISQFYEQNSDLYDDNVPLRQLVEDGASASQLYEENQEVYNDSIPVVPMIDERTPISALRAEYENGSASFVQGIDWLADNGFGSIRRSKGDGNCFYRSLGFAYVERILQASDGPAMVAASFSNIESMIPLLNETNFKDIYEDFYGPLINLLQQIAQPDLYGELTPQALLAAFQDSAVSDSIVFFLRLLTSTQMRADRDEYEPFITHPDGNNTISLQDFCQKYVEVMGTEADHVQAIALCNALKISVDIASLNGNNFDGKVDFFSFAPKGIAKESDPLQLLYRPGHYDILIKSGKGKQRSD